MRRGIWWYSGRTGKWASPSFADWQRLWQTLKATGVFGVRPLLGVVRLAGVAARHGLSPYTLVAWHASRTPEAVAIEAADGTLTYRQLQARADALIAQLDLKPGERVGLLGRGGAAWLVGLLAASRLGAEVVLLNTLHSPPEWAAQIQKLGLALVLHEADYARGLREAPHGAALYPLSHYSLPLYPQSLYLLSLVSAQMRPDKVLPPRLGSVTLLTSGSTGTPRAIRRQTGLERAQAILTAADFLQRLAPRYGEKVWLPPPLFHGHGLSALMLTLGFGGRLVLSPSGEAATMWDSLHATRPDWLVLVPTLLHRLLDTAPTHLNWQPRRVVSGSASLPPELAQHILRTFGPVLFNLYGTTETGPIAAASVADVLANPLSVGRVWQGVRVDVQRGTVRVQSPLQAVATDWWDTGDLATWDDAGRLCLLGRADDCFVCGGENIDPEALERRIAALPTVRECAVWGEPDAEYGQVVHALIVPVGGWVSPAQLSAELAQALPRTLRPRSLTLVSELPRNAAGKLARRQLREARLQQRPGPSTLSP